MTSTENEPRKNQVGNARSGEGGFMNGELPTSVLKSIVWGDDLELDNSDPDNEPNPFEKLKHDGAVRAALGKSAESISVDLGWVLPPTSDVDDADGEFEKSSTIVRGHGRRTLGKKLGITRFEEVVTESGDRWLHGFNAANELIDARFLESAE
jgi:hypothetical protein